MGPSWNKMDERSKSNGVSTKEWIGALFLSICQKVVCFRTFWSGVAKYGISTHQCLIIVYTNLFPVLVHLDIFAPTNRQTIKGEKVCMSKNKTTKKKKKRRGLKLNSTASLHSTFNPSLVSSD